MFKRVLQKTVFSLAAFSTGMAFGIAAEAHAAGLQLIQLFQG